MKELIIAILILSALTAWFSFRGEIVPLESQKEGWAFFGGDTESPIPQAGEDGEMEAFIVNAEAEQETQAEQTATVQQKSPITVSVERTKAEKATSDDSEDSGMFLLGIAVGALAAEIATAGVIGILYLRDKHGNQTGKA